MKEKKKKKTRILFLRTAHRTTAQNKAKCKINRKSGKIEKCQEKSNK